MTDTNPIEAEDTEHPAAADSSEGSPEQPDADEAQPKNREERFRKQLRATEAERDQLSERLTRLQQSEVERLAAHHLADGADFWRDGAELDQVLTEDGDIDPQKVTELAAALTDTHTHWRRTTPPAAPLASTVTANDIIGDGPSEVSWADVLKGRVR